MMTKLTRKRMDLEGLKGSKKLLCCEIILAIQVQDNKIEYKALRYFSTAPTSFKLQPHQLVPRNTTP